MANLWKGDITNREWEDFSTISGITLTADTKYQLQVIGKCYLCDMSEEPEDDEGFLIDTTEPFGFTKKGDATLWVKAYTYKCKLNIAE